MNWSHEKWGWCIHVLPVLQCGSRPRQPTTPPRALPCPRYAREAPSNTTLQSCTPLPHPTPQPHSSTQACNHRRCTPDTVPRQEMIIGPTLPPTAWDILKRPLVRVRWQTRSMLVRRTSKAIDSHQVVYSTRSFPQVIPAGMKRRLVPEAMLSRREVSIAPNTWWNQPTWSPSHWVALVTRASSHPLKVLLPWRIKALRLTQVLLGYLVNIIGMLLWSVFALKVCDYGISLDSWLCFWLSKAFTVGHFYTVGYGP